ncbi:MAG: DUF3426 domain-containing protein [Pseudomonadales bacterium]
MSSGPVTECPACSTRFRVGESQLEAAGGQVRCGACLNVFQARDHWVTETYDDDVVDMSNAPKLEGALSEEFLALEERERAAREKRFEDSGDEKDEKDEIEEEEKLDQEELALRERTTAEYRRTSVLGIENAEIERKDETVQARAGETGEETLGDAKIPDLASFGFNTGAEPTPGSRRTWMYVGAGSALLVLFIIQVLYSQAAGLSPDSRMRPFYQQFCGVFGCTPAEVREPERIRSRQVVVQSHQQAKNAIVVDAVIYNDAPYPQAFPWIELQFSDMNGRPVASRRFSPGEYLAGDLDGETEMPSKTPIRVSLSLVDPGRDAVNYIMLFY